MKVQFSVLWRYIFYLNSVGHIKGVSTFLAKKIANSL